MSAVRTGVNVSPIVSERTCIPQAVALGYLQAQLLLTAAELDDAKHDLTDCAQRHGCALGTVHVERIDRSLEAFSALVDQLMCTDVAAVIVPGTRHLAALGPPDLVRKHLENTTGARVLIAQRSP